MTATALQPLALDLALPWQPLAEQEEVFKKWSIRAAVVLLLFFLAMPWLPVFEAELPQRDKELVKTKVILKKPIPPKPEPVASRSKPKPKPQPKPEEPQKVAQKKEQAKPKLGNSTKKQPDNKPAVSAKASVQQSQGLAKVSSELSALRGALNVAGMKKKQITTNSAGMVATANHSMLGENRNSQGSTGISVSENMMKGEITQLSSHEATSVEGVVTEGVSNGSSAYHSYQSGRRDMESIRRIIEEKKGSIYALYNKALDQYPELNGKFVFSLVIQPDGNITNLKLVNSELSLSELEQNILARIQQINFGKEDVSATEVVYKFVFIPS